MGKIKHMIENGFEAFAGFLYKNNIIILICIVVLIGFLISRIPGITFDTSTESLLHKSDPTVLQYDTFKEQFGRDEMIIIAIKSESIFTERFMKKLKSLHDRLEKELPYVKNVTSLINARNIYAQDDEILVEDLLRDLEDDVPIDYPALKKKVIANPLYQDFLITRDGTFTTISIEIEAFTPTEHTTDDIDALLAEFDDSGEKAEPEKKEYLSDQQNSEVVNQIRAILSDYTNDDDFKTYVAGIPVMTDVLKRTMIKSMRTFSLLSILVIMIALSLIFRRISGVLMPLIVVICSLLSTAGMMALFKIPIQVPTQILPSFILVVGVGASVHVLAIFYYNFTHAMTKQAAIVKALKHSGLAIVMTSLTTAAGLLSFSFSEILPVVMLGIFGALGVVFSLLYTIIMLPALISLLPLKQVKTTDHKNKHVVMDKVLMFFINVSYKRSKLILIISIILIAVSLFALLRIKFSHFPIAWLPNDNSLKHDTRIIDKELNGTATFEIILDTGVENGIKEPAFLNAIDTFTEAVATYESETLFIGKIISITTLLKEMNKALNENNDEYYTIAQNKNLIAQELLLFENSGSDELERLADPYYRKTRITIKVPTLDALLYVDLEEFIKQKLASTFDEHISITVTGFLPLMSRTLHSLMSSTAKSYIIAFLVITLMMILLIGKIHIGLISMIPNILPIFFALGVMGIFRIDLDMFVMLVGCIAIGLAVDDTIHFMHNFTRYYGQSKDVKDAIEKTLFSTGRAMLTTSIVLSFGFFIFTLAPMGNLFNFGLLTGIAIVIALLADFLLAPALMVLLYKNKQDTKK